MLTYDDFRFLNTTTFRTTEKMPIFFFFSLIRVLKGDTLTVWELPPTYFPNIKEFFKLMLFILRSQHFLKGCGERSVSDKYSQSFPSVCLKNESCL